MLYGRRIEEKERESSGDFSDGTASPWQTLSRRGHYPAGEKTHNGRKLRGVAARWRRRESLDPAVDVAAWEKDESSEAKPSAAPSGPPRPSQSSMRHYPANTRPGAERGE